MTKAIDNSDSIAIIGITGRFPGASNIDDFWENLKNSVESISYIPDEKNPKLIHADGMLIDIDKFDADFFDYSPREAEIIDPQHRIFLEETWSLLEQTGYTPDKYDGIISIMAGSNMSGYLIRNLYSNPGLVEQLGTFKIMLANGQDFVSTRASYKLNLNGPSVNINTLCSSSLVAVHYACNSLLDYSSDIVIAGGVNIQVSRSEALFYQEGGIGASDGHCRAFDAKANGTVSGSGIALVALKRLEDAIEDGDTIHAVILGSAVNNDGGNKNSFTAPNADGQADCIAEAIEMSGISPETISYIEAHGTGTNLGDPIEIAGLTKAYRAYTDKKQYCAIGSVKTNIGHLVTAGGVASLIKTVLAMKNKKLPQSLNFTEPNPKINFQESPFFVNTELRDWESDETPLRAGISSFGIGGTNAHVIIEEAPLQRSSSDSRKHQVLCLSAKTKSALDTMSNNIKTFLKNNDIISADAAYTLNIGRKDFIYRKVYIFDNMQKFLSEDIEEYTKHQTNNIKSASFIFPGDEILYQNMCRDLYNTEKEFKEYFDLCNKLSKEESGIDLYKILYPGHKESLKSIEDKKIRELSLFTVEYSIAKLLNSWGIIPENMLGYNIGEITAACLAGVLKLEDVIKILNCNDKDKKQIINSIELFPPSIQLVSSTNNTWLTEDEALSHDYWLKVMLNTNNNQQNLKFLTENTNNILIKIGYNDDINKNEKEITDNIILDVVKNPDDSINDIKKIITFIGKYWLEAGELDWENFYKNEKRNRIPLPTYPFERESYWIEPGEGINSGMKNEKYDPKKKIKFHKRPELSTEYVAPNDEREKKLAAIFEELVGIRPIGINDNFFELGGHSLMAARITTEVKDEFGIELPLDSLYDEPTISYVCKFIDAVNIGKMTNTAENRQEGFL